MNCEQCQELISVYLDNELADEISTNVRKHLAMCAECAKVCEDFAMILDFCGLEETDCSLPPNSKALWCRITNIIETEIQAEIPKQIIEEKPKRNWQFSFSQVFASVLGIALVSSLLTIVAIKNYSAPPDVSGNVAPSVFERALGNLGVIETAQQTRENRIKEQQAAIDYWNKRVEMKRASWNPNMRDAFDRNLNEINQVVVEYNTNLQQNPQDDFSSEMLDSALSEKMELLREFAEL